MNKTMAVSLNGKRVDVPYEPVNILDRPGGTVIYQQKNPVLPELGAWIEVTTFGSRIPSFVTGYRRIGEPEGED